MNPYWHRLHGMAWLSVALVAMIPTRAISSADLDTMRDSTWNYTLVPSANANTVISSLRADGSWADINYDEIPAANWSVITHYSRVLTIAMAYRQPGNARYNDAQALDAAARALNFIQGTVCENCPRPGNWWSWEIGVPSRFGPLLLLLKGALASQTYADALATYRYLIYPEPHLTGANLADSAMNHLYLALLDSDADRMRRVRDAMAAECVVQMVRVDGIKPDGVFYQHGAMLYNGGYGRVFENNIARYVVLARGTEFQLGSTPFNVFGDYVLDGTRWMIFNNYYEISCRGRDMTRGNPSQFTVPPALLVLADPLFERRDEAIAAAKHFMQIRSGHDARFAAYVAQIQASSVSAADVLGHRPFPYGDFCVHRRADWYASLKLLSQRTKAAELVNDEGRASWHLADGALWVLLDGRDYYTNDVLPTLDWHRVPGTTVVRKPLAPAEGYGQGSKSFVGGVALGPYGVAVMDFKANTAPLEARKSYFFFDDEIVCLGDGINSSDSVNPVETTIMQRRLYNSLAPVSIDGSTTPVAEPGDSASFSSARWAHCEDIGYYFPADQPLRARRMAQEGRWSDLNGNQSATLRQNPILTFWVDHGVGVQDGRYAYFILPRKTAAATKAYAESPRVRIRASGPTAHAVAHDALGLLAVVFWGSGTQGELSASQKCVVLRRKRGADYQLVVGDPSRTTQWISLTIRESLEPVEVPSGSFVIDVGNQTELLLPLPGDGSSAQALFALKTIPATPLPSQFHVH
jgi:hypothetical protein